MAPARPLALALLLVGCRDAAAPASLDGQASLPRAQWLDTARTELRRESCTHGSRFRRCSLVTRDECEHEISRALIRCAQDWGPQLPERVEAGADDRHYRDQLTGCMWHHAAMALGPTRLDMLCLLSSR